MARWTRRELLRSAGVGAAALMAPGLALGAARGRRRPNILFILMDDMGWMDTTVYGSRYYETPNMERLARRGMTFTDAYAACPICSPTRASIMTGKYPARLGITSAAGHLPPLPPDAPIFPKSGPPNRKVLLPQSRHHLPLEEYTIAEALRDAGYRTGFIGKWHLGQPEELWPNAQGFEVNIGGGGYPGPPDYFSPYGIKSLPDGPKGEYITDRLTDEAVKFIEAHREEPFFLCLWHYAVHSLWGFKPELARHFLDKKDPRGKQANAVMAAMLKSADDGIGRVIDKLDELGLTRDTIIIFTSDNGGLTTSKIDMPVVPPPDGEDLRPPQRMRRDYYRVVGDMAPTNNYPLRGGKGTIFEGGTREPCVVCWPGVVKPGSRSSAIISSIDFYPTLLEAAGVAPNPKQILDGESIVPVLKGTGKLKRDALFCHFPHTTGEMSPAGTWVRQGDWKLIRVYDTSPLYPNRYELYNLRDDLSETKNLADRYPERVKAMDALIDRHLEEVHAAVPIPNPDYDPEALVEVQGWRASGTCKLKKAEGMLRLESSGNDPILALLAAPNVEGALVVKMRMRSTSKGGGQWRWTDPAHPQFGPVACVDYQPEHDGRWHEYEVKFTSRGRIAQLRVDPSAAEGTVDFQWIRLSKEDGTLVQEWDFTK